MIFTETVKQLKGKLSSKFVQNLGWLGAGELIVRVSRLITTVILARLLSPYDYGLAALVLTTYELAQVFTRIGIAAKIIQTDDENLEEICNNAYSLNWLVCFGVFVFQCLAAFPVAQFYRDASLITPICLLASIYLMTPLGLVQAVLIQRDNRLKITAISSTIQLLVANILTAIFAVLGFGMWAIIIPRILVTPIDIMISLRNCSWRPAKRFVTKRWGEIFSFGIHFLGMALLNALRNNLDYLIVGRFLGVEELGIYFFAFNAGLGISLSIIQSITTAFYPYLCEVRSDFLKFRHRYFHSLKTIALIIFPLVFLQASLAPIYVPIVFGKHWTIAIPILMVICISAIPRPFFSTATNLLVAVGKPNLSLRGNILFTAIFTGGLLIGVRWQALGVAISVLISHMLFMPLFTVWASRYVFGKKEVKHSY